MSEATDSHSASIRDEFAHQADSFARSPTMSLAETLDAVVELVPEDGAARWAELACGPGLIARAMAPRVGSVLGLDLTPAMIDKARAEAAEAGVRTSASSSATRPRSTSPTTPSTARSPASASTTSRLPIRVLEEMRRVVKPGGYVVVADHVTDDDGEAAAWHEEIERLRDPSHWACLTPSRLPAMGERAGLEPDLTREVPFVIDFEEWINRGSGGPAHADLIDRLLGEAPPTAASFVVAASPASAPSSLRNSLHRWRVPS